MDSLILDKVSLNKQIVLMRYDVRRSKVHMINKLSRQAKILKNKKGTEEQIEKNKYKAERLIKELSLVKTLKDDDVSRFAINATTEELQKMQNDTKLLLVTRSMARLAAHKFIAASVKEFREKYPDWKQLLPNLLNARKTKVKTNKKEISDDKSTPVNTKLKSATVIKKDFSEKKLDNSDHQSVSDTVCGDMNDLETDKDSDESDCEPEKLSYLETEKNKEFKILSIEKKIKKENFSSDSDEGINLEPTRITTNIQPNKNKKDHTILPKEKIKNEFISDFDVEEEGEEQLNNKELKVVDPFFITTENKEYVTSQVPILERSSNDTDHLKTNWKYGSNNFTQLDKNAHKENWKHNKIKNNLFNKSSKINNYSQNNFEKNKHLLKSRVQLGTRRERRMALQSGNEKLKEEKLHPSWEAKKKQSSIAVFQGKKIEFND